MRCACLLLMITMFAFRPSHAADDQPYSQDQLAAAMTAFSQAQYANAATLLDAILIDVPQRTQDHITLSFLRAVARIRAGLVPEQSDLRRAVEDSTAGLTSHAAWYLGDYIWRQNKSIAKAYELASPYLKQVAFPGRFGIEARKYLIQGLIAQNRIEQACKLAEQTATSLSQRAAEASAWLTLASCLESLGRQQYRKNKRQVAKKTFVQAAGLYHRVASLWQYKREGRLAKSYMLRLNKKGYSAQPDMHWLLQRAQNIVAHPKGLVDRYRLWRVRRLLPRDTSDRVGAEAELLWAQLNHRYKRFRYAAKSLNRLRRSAPTEELRAQASLLLGHLTARRNPTRAINQYLKIAQVRPNTLAAAQALYSAGEISRRRGCYDQAQKIFERCSQDYKLQYSALCRWGLSWMAYRDGRYTESLIWLTPLLNIEAEYAYAPTSNVMYEEPNTDTTEVEELEPKISELNEKWFSLNAAGTNTFNLAQRARYWHALIQQKLGQTAQAAEEYTKLCNDYPFSYYGLIAWSRLAILDMAPVLSSDKTDVLQNPTLAELHPEVAIAVVYLRFGLTAEVRQTLPGLHRNKLDAYDRRWTSWVRQEIGDYNRSFRVAPVPMDGGLPDYPASGWRIDASLAYPRAFWEQVEKEAHPAVPAELLYALMRAESGFWPRARSPVNAHGLTQVIAKTARPIARRLKIRRFHTSRLHDPAIAIRIGSTYLADLLQHYQHPALAICAYNAGEKSVNRWLKARGDLDLDAFIEEIPYAETARYSRKLLSWWSIYRVLYEPDVSLPLPIDFGLPQQFKRVSAITHSLADSLKK